MYIRTKRKAFSMITAIFLIVIMSSVGAFVLNLSSKMVKNTTYQYQHEQAILLANSYTEYAVLAVTANEHNNSNCLNKITGTYPSINPQYTITVDISYIGRGLDGSCNTLRGTILANDVNTSKSPLNIIVDTFINYPDYDHPNNNNLTYHRRTLQKI